MAYYGHVSSLPSRFLKPNPQSAAQLRSLIVPTCERPMLRCQRIDRGSAYRSFPASRTNRRASLSLPQVAMPHLEPSTNIQKMKLYGFKSKIIQYIINLFSRVPYAFLGKHFFLTDSTEGWDPEYEPTEAVEAVRPQKEVVSWNCCDLCIFFFTQHPTLNINKGILQLRLSNRSGFQHVRYHLLYLMCEWCEMKCLSIMFLRRLFFHPTSNIEHQQRDLAVETLKPLRVSTCALPSSVSNVRMMRDEVSI